MPLLLTSLSENVGDIALPIIAVVAVFFCVLKIFELIKVQNNLNKTIILVPLYKRHIALSFGVVFCMSLIVACIVLIVLTGKLLAFASIIVIGISVMALLIFMLFFKCAVVNSGVVLPYKFLDWHHLYDYYIDNYSIMFSGNKTGQLTITSTTISLKYNKADEKKLELVLNSNRVKHHSKLR